MAFGGGTINHAWSGGPLTILSEFIAGVAPETVGYSRYHVLPQMGSLKRLDTVVPSVKGDITVKILKSATRFKLDLNSPQGTTAIVGIPLLAKSIRVTVNGKDAGAAQPGLKPLGRDAHYLKFQVAPGKWSFAAEKP